MEDLRAGHQTVIVGLKDLPNGLHQHYVRSVLWTTFDLNSVILLLRRA